MPQLAEVIAALEEWYDPRWAEPWDAVGLVCGDPAQAVDRIVLAVDAVPETVAETCRRGAQLLFVHHPLLLTAVHGLPADDPKGALVHQLIRAGSGLFVAHTNGDVADPGVSDALADRFGLRELRPLAPQSQPALDKLVVFVPSRDTDRLIDALAAAGAGAVGDYDRCAWIGEGQGRFRPLPGAQPAIGVAGRDEVVAESRVEMVVPAERRAQVIAALRATHPYEEPAFDLLAQSPVPGRRGTGRVGELPAALSLRELVALAARALPPTVWGIRAAGDPDRIVRTVAVGGGSCGSLTELAGRAGAEAFLTADLKHHPVVEAVTERAPAGPALIDAAHWATEAPWLDVVAARLRRRFGTTVDVHVSGVRTDPWTLHATPPPATDPSTDTFVETSSIRP